jgi:hypothetical protein
MDVVGQSLGAGGFDGLQPVGEHGPEDLDHLPVAAGLAFELALNPAQGRWPLGTPLIVLHSPEHAHALKEVDAAAQAVETPAQVADALRYVMTGRLPG